MGLKRQELATDGREKYILIQHYVTYSQVDVEEKSERRQKKEKLAKKSNSSLQVLK